MPLELMLVQTAAVPQHRKLGVARLTRTEFYLAWLIYFALCFMQKGHSDQPDMFWTTHHTKPDPKSMWVMLLFLWGV